VLGTAIADASGNWTVTSSKLSDGDHKVTAKQTDSVGRASTTSGSLSVTIDTVAPKAPTTPDLTAASDSGTSSTDNITNVSTPTFSGTADAGSIVQVFDGATLISSITTPANGIWTTPSSIFLSSDGTHLVSAIAMDVAGNTSAASAKLSFILDRVAPAPPTYASMTTNANGSVKLTGSAEANLPVTVFDNTSQIGIITASSTGAWSFTTATLSDTLHVFLTRATDVAGNVGGISGANGSAQLGSTQSDLLKSTQVGNDLLTGGGGADTFSFLAGFGKDIINDFVATGVGHDVINFHAISALNSFDNVVTNHSVQSGANVVISQDASNTLTLKNVTLGSLTSADFTFV
jgi:hypothetical protein